MRQVLTPEQEEALKSGTHKSITASAGSGKTFVLVELFLNLFVAAENPKSIVAITFTRKAAGEMKARLAKRLIEKLGEDLTPDEREQIVTARERVASARISTIHSFCYDILSDYPIESGLTPGFSLITEAEKHRLSQAAVEETIRKILSESNHALNSEVKRICLIYELRSVLSLLQNVIVQGELIHGWEESGLQHFTTENLQCIALVDLLNCLPTALVSSVNYFAQALASADAEMSEAFSLLRSIITLDVRDLTAKIPDEIIAQITKMTARFQRLQSDSKITGTFTFGLKSLKKANPDFHDFYKLNKEDFDNQLADIGNLVETLGMLSDNNDDDVCRINAALLAVTFEAQELYKTEKKRRNVLDNDDLILLVDTLLATEAQQSIQRDITYVLIDEYQDTNNIQFSLIQKLIGDEETDVQPKLVVVGDPKQSIYQFRGADVRVFQQTQQYIHNLSNKQTSSDSQLAQHVNLSATFRLRGAIAAFTNEVCSLVMPTDARGYEVAYEPLTCARDTDSDDFMGDGIDLLCGTDEEVVTDNGEDMLSRDELICRYILMRRAGTNEAQTEPPAYSDFAILVRTRAGIQGLATKLELSSIPYTIHSGADFYNTQEVYDIEYMLRFLYDQSDNLAFAAILHAPYFSLSDAELLAIAERAGYDTWWATFKRMVSDNSSSDRHAYYLIILETLESLILRCTSSTLPVLIHACMADTLWYRCIGATEDSDAIMANVEKLIEEARSFVSRGFRTLPDFVEYLTEMRVLAKEPEAPVLTTTDSVSILTLHSAKGLEFPEVILYDCDRGVKNSVREVDKKCGFILHPTVPVTAPNLGLLASYLKRQGMSFIKASAKLKSAFAESAESKRLLYVGMTRAKNKLTCAYSLRPASEAWYKIQKGSFLSYLNARIAALPDRTVPEHSHTDSIHTTLNVYNSTDRTFSDRNVAIKVARSTWLPLLESPKAIAADVSAAPPSLLLDYIPLTPSDWTISATQIMQFERDAEDYLLRYRLGFPMEETASSVIYDDVFDTQPDTRQATFAGTLLHDVLSRVSEYVDVRGIVNTDALQGTLADCLVESGKEINETIRTRILKECLGIFSTPFFKRHAHIFLQSEAEQRFTVPIGNNFLTGIFDVIVTIDGTIEVWDWKTNYLNNHFTIDLLSTSYKRQMQLYAFALSKLFPEQKQFTSRLLFTRRATQHVQDADWIRTFVFDVAELTDIQPELEKTMHEIIHASLGITIHE